MPRLASRLAHPESCKGFEMSHCGVGFAHQPWARRLVSVGEAHPPWTHGNVVGWASPRRSPAIADVSSPWDGLSIRRINVATTGRYAK